jgi:hypothetical protein
VLGKGASDADLLRATALNHRAWFARWARAADGEVRTGRGAWWSVAPASVTLAFPQLSHARAGETIDRVIADARHVRAREIGCWTLLPPVPRGLGAYLVGRGFQWGWKPHWMALDLDELGPTAPPADIRVELVKGTPEWDVDDLPYHARGGAELKARLSGARPRRVWHVAALRDGRVVGQAMLNLTGGRHGVAGIFDAASCPPSACAAAAAP